VFKKYFCAIVRTLLRAEWLPPMVLLASEIIAARLGGF
jgi:hypothetical protein